MGNSQANHSGKLIDRFGREISYLRISLTERCNLRCNYCYGSVIDPPNRAGDLSNDQLVKLISVFAALGIEKIRFTGGEPLLRKGIIELIEKTSAIDGVTQIGITTNGLLLNKLLQALTDAGLNRINISLDTLNSGKFQKITGINGFDRVFRGIRQAVDGRLFPMVKVNTVVMRGVNDDEIPAFADWALADRIDLRFIEFMPTCKSGWGQERILYENDIKKIIDLPLLKIPQYDRNHGPARTYYYPGKPGRISFISPVSGSFCRDCNRLRLTSTGDLIGCLFGNLRVNLRELVEGDYKIEKTMELLKSIVASPNFRRLSLKQSISNTEPFMRGIGG